MQLGCKTVLVKLVSVPDENLMDHQGGFVGTLFIYFNLMTVWDRKPQMYLGTQKYIRPCGEMISKSVVDANNESSC